MGEPPSNSTVFHSRSGDREGCVESRADFDFECGDSSRLFFPRLRIAAPRLPTARACGFLEQKKRRCGLGRKLSIGESSRDLIPWIDDAARDSAACMIRRGLQLHDFLPDGYCRLVCSRRSGLANRPPTTALTLFSIALTPKPTTRTRLGKFQRNPFIMAIPANKAALMPKSASDVGENSSENRLSWRSRFDWITLVPKPATGFGENRMGTCLSWRLRNQARSD